MKDRESYSSSLDDRKFRAIQSKHLIQKSLEIWDIGEEDELAHLESLIEMINPILNTPFKS